jgi:hypothetical protein
MSLLRSLSDGLRSLFRKERIEGELDEELRGFLEMVAEEKIKQGTSRKDAFRAVRLERGNVEVAKGIVRAAGWESFIETLWQDLRFTVRNKCGRLTYVWLRFAISNLCLVTVYSKSEGANVWT